jgi:hypothetical protein
LSIWSCPVVHWASSYGRAVAELDDVLERTFWYPADARPIEHAATAARLQVIACVVLERDHRIEWVVVQNVTDKEAGVLTCPKSAHDP